MSEQHLQVLAAAMDRIAGVDSDAAWREGQNYRAYEEQRLRGLEHEQVAHLYANPEALRTRFIDALNDGARRADDIFCSGCGTRGFSQCQNCAEAERRMAGR